MATPDHAGPEPAMLCGRHVPDVSTTVGDPDEMLDKFTTGAQENWGRFSDPVLDELYKQQAQEMNKERRIQLVRQMDSRILEKVWRIQGL
jgi:ABC-type transport system substrate-binding protein